MKLYQEMLLRSGVTDPVMQQTMMQQFISQQQTQIVEQSKQEAAAKKDKEDKAKAAALKAAADQQEEEERLFAEAEAEAEMKRDDEEEKTPSETGSQSSHLTEAPLEGGFVHPGWSYGSYLDRLERIERFPIMFGELRKDYDTQRHELGAAMRAILEGARERRAFFKTVTGQGANQKEPVDEGECHRLSRDSIRRRFDAERHERLHLRSRDQFMSYVTGFVEQTRDSKVRWVYFCLPQLVLQPQLATGTTPPRFRYLSRVPLLVLVAQSSRMS